MDCFTISDRTVAGNLSKTGSSLGYVSAIDSEGRTIWIADAHRDDGKWFVVHAMKGWRPLSHSNRRFDPAERPEACGTREIAVACADTGRKWRNFGGFVMSICYAFGLTDAST